MNSHVNHLNLSLPAAITQLVAAPLAQCNQTELPAVVGDLLCQLVDNGLDALPLPGEGDTLQRWRALAAVAGLDLSLAKLFESHTDALAILAQAGEDDLPHLALWGVWCAESPQAVLKVRPLARDETGHDRLLLDGEKHWCSGAHVVSHGLISYRDAQGRSCLAALDLDQEGVQVIDDDWMAVGMAATRTARLQLKNAVARPIGSPDFYLQRPGFWQGGAGIAACWFGAATALADTLREQLAQRHDEHALARLGSTECALHAAAQCLRAAARWIDRNPATDAMRLTLRARLTVEAAAQQSINDIGAALGPRPYCADRRTARLLADLPVFLRQSHAGRDLAQLGATCLDTEHTPWQL
ncbi:acyl-CoA dehydrogenase [Herbaspirillum sp. alder98]|uniref:acyl-CoA dehydrogenase n=1 Tax=Herbaspirillum sp. alder98 TaxID=2913096 RepID=UPI001CD854C5|nr:acyl-CoA dehydrogenase [Herbaspirillum sp. alder98]MCA1323254.1 acyl-CoA dehydrogenase [Herbaspirillum sp. alder98]